MMPIILFAGLFAAVLLSAFALVDAIEVRVFAVFLIVGLVVILANRFSLLHGEAIHGAVSQHAFMADPPGSLSHEGVLRAFGSYRAVSAIRASLHKVMVSAIRVGSGFTFRTSDTWENVRQQSMFLIMPYGEAWSDDVHDTVCQAATDSCWTVSRGDRRFSHQDLLLNIWAEVCRSEIVLADITSHTPNVLYEIGLAHAIGKPVVLLLQEGERIPFDLSVQRTIFYNPSAPGWKAALAQSICRLLEALDAERPDAGSRVMSVPAPVSLSPPLSAP
jgi:hypothetical protein